MATGPRGFLVPLLYSEILDGVPTRADLEAAVGKAFCQRGASYHRWAPPARGVPVGDLI